MGGLPRRCRRICRHSLTVDSSGLPKSRRGAPRCTGRSRSKTTGGGKTDHGNAGRGGSHRHDVGVSTPRHERGLPVHLTRQTKDYQSKEEFDFPVEYMFKDVPEKGLRQEADPISATLREMDIWGIEKGLIGVGDPGGTGAKALELHPDRFIPSSTADPNQGMAGINRLVKEHEMFGTRAVGIFPAGTFPQVPINGNLMYPIYAKCVELGIPVFCCAGVPGPRLKAACQHVELIDEVMFDFPDLVFVTRHGCEPWTGLAIKLMLKWPGLHYSTSAFAPKYYPKDVIDYAKHTRLGQDHLCGLLSDGALPRAYVHRDAERCIERRGVAEVPPDQRVLRVLGL